MVRVRGRRRNTIGFSNSYRFRESFLGTIGRRHGGLGRNRDDRLWKTGRLQRRSVRVRNFEQPDESETARICSRQQPYGDLQRGGRSRQGDYYPAHNTANCKRTKLSIPIIQRTCRNQSCRLSRDAGGYTGVIWQDQVAQQRYTTSGTQC